VVKGAAGVRLAGLYLNVFDGISSSKATAKKFFSVGGRIEFVALRFKSHFFLFKSVATNCASILKLLVLVNLLISLSFLQSNARLHSEPCQHSNCAACLFSSKVPVIIQNL
jgi:hypothetical protein